MNQDQAQGKLTQLNGKIKETWGKLTDNDLALLDGKRDQFLGKVQEAYGLSKEDAEKRFGEMEKACGCNTNKAA